MGSEVAAGSDKQQLSYKLRTLCLDIKLQIQEIWYHISLRNRSADLFMLNCHEVLWML